MNFFLSQSIKKYIAVFCLSIYILFSFLSNVGATLCFGTNQHRHIGIHALSYDSCPDGQICNLIKSRQSFSNYKNKFDHSTFQINLNKIPSLNFNEITSCAACSVFCFDINLFEEKHNKINRDIYESPKVPGLEELKTIILIM